MPDENAGLVGKVIGGCRIEKLLGGGAMGSVYHAHHLNLKKDVAIKVMAPNLAGQTQYVQRFVSEARLAAQIEHPNIVQVLNVGRQESVYYIVMQYVEGESVQARLMRDGPLPPLEAARIALGIARGLAAAHAKGIIHRDIKPANVLLTRTGEVKVADLGLAKATLGIEDSALTQVGETMGTPQYMPPEQAEDARSADARSDIYSLGCTLYHMLVGTPPFSAKTMIAVLKKQITETAPLVSQVRPDVPKDLSDLVARMMAKQREDRPQTAADIADALQRLCAAPALPSPSRHDHRFPWWAVAAGVGAAFLLLIVLAAAQRTPAQKAYEAARANWNRNPAAYTAALAEFQHVKQAFPNSPWAAKAEESCVLVKAAREKAAAAAFEHVTRSADAATQQSDYAAALKVWDAFPRELLADEYVEKVRIAKLKARLPPRINGFMKALRAGKDDGILQYLNLEKGATEQARNVHLGLLRLGLGLAAWGAELQAWQIETMEFNEEVTRCNAAVTLKFRTKAGQERTVERTPQTWQYIDDDWSFQVAQRALKRP